MLNTQCLYMEVQSNAVCILSCHAEYWTGIHICVFFMPSVEEVLVRIYGKSGNSPTFNRYIDTLEIRNN